MTSFNTENGRGRAAILLDFEWDGYYDRKFQYRERSWEGCNSFATVLNCHAHLTFQYRERSWEGCNQNKIEKTQRKPSSFNTENGRGRAAIGRPKEKATTQLIVSIPRTDEGGLQYCAPEPLGLLAPDE